ncbi:MAG: DUF3392 domain-containing protein [Fibrobacter sp.]|jgi:hypothetical protein|nr:DUF3392 domain-containing protein [Fibrobacter sp.]
MASYLHDFAQFLREHLASISVGIISTLLVIYGGVINRRLKKWTKGFPLAGRLALFIIVCSFGYAFVSSQAVRYLKRFLFTLPDAQLIFAVAGAFILLGFLAKTGNDI